MEWECGRSIRKHSEQKRDWKPKEEEGGRACHGNACRDSHLRLHGNLKEKAPLKSSSEARPGVLGTGPQRFSCPGKAPPGPVCDLESRVQQQRGSPWKGGIGM